MSRGPGRIERTIAALFQRNPDAAFTLDQACALVFKIEPTAVRETHRKSLARAARHYASKCTAEAATEAAAVNAALPRGTPYDELVRQRSGREFKYFVQPVFAFEYSLLYNPRSDLSRTIACLKREGFTDDEIHAKLAPGGDCHHLIEVVDDIDPDPEWDDGGSVIYSQRNMVSFDVILQMERNQTKRRKPKKTE
jgi:hypothetical protein